MGKMDQIVRCDWLPEWADEAIFPARDRPLYPARKSLFFMPYSKTFID